VRSHGCEIGHCFAHRSVDAPRSRFFPIDRSHGADTMEEGRRHCPLATRVPRRANPQTFVCRPIAGTGGDTGGGGATSGPPAGGDPGAGAGAGARESRWRTRAGGRANWSRAAWRPSGARGYASRMVGGRPARHGRGSEVATELWPERNGAGNAREEHVRKIWDVAETEVFAGCASQQIQGQRTYWCRD